MRSETYPFGASEEEWLTSIREVRDRFGDRDFFAEWARAIDPAILEDDEEFEHFVWMHRLSVSPNAAADFARMQMDKDVTDVLGSIRVPTVPFRRPRASDRLCSEHRRRCEDA